MEEVTTASHQLLNQLIFPSQAIFFLDILSNEIILDLELLKMK